MARALLGLALSALRCDALKLVTALALDIFRALAFSAARLMTALGTAEPGRELAITSLYATATERP